MLCIAILMQLKIANFSNLKAFQLQKGHRTTFQVNFDVIYN